LASTPTRRRPIPSPAIVPYTDRAALAPASLVVVVACVVAMTTVDGRSPARAERLNRFNRSPRARAELSTERRARDARRRVRRTLSDDETRRVVH